MFSVYSKFGHNLNDRLFKTKTNEFKRRMLLQCEYENIISNIEKSNSTFRTIIEFNGHRKTIILKPWKSDNFINQLFTIVTIQRW